MRLRGRVDLRSTAEVHWLRPRPPNRYAGRHRPTYRVRMGDERDDNLLDEVGRRLESSNLDDGTQLLVLAATFGDAELADALGGGAVSAPVPVRQSAGELPRAYLTEIAVEGFRGIAGAARIGLSPGPGLTLVVGRNGSGKSSFAEAAELAITGTTSRWSAGRSRVWQEGWRNLHHHGPRSIRVRLSPDGDPMPTTVSLQWDDGATLAGGTATIQRKGEPVQPLADAGWRGALATYRPFLSYNELGGLLEDGPSELYDAISQVLGLELLSAAEQRLIEARKGLEEGARAVRAEAKRLGDLVRALNDPRAVTCAAALTRRGGWDIDVIDSVAGSSAIATDDLELAVLTTLAAVEPPDPAAAHAAAAQLREALSAAAQQRSSAAAGQRRRSGAGPRRPGRAGARGARPGVDHLRGVRDGGRRRRGLGGPHPRGDRPSPRPVRGRGGGRPTARRRGGGSP